MRKGGGGKYNKKAGNYIMEIYKFAPPKFHI